MNTRNLPSDDEIVSIIFTDLLFDGPIAEAVEASRDDVPLVSIGPSGIGGEYQKEIYG